MTAVVENQELETEFNSITAPMTTGDIYAVGMKVNNIAVSLYRVMAENGTDPVVNVVDECMKCYQVEADNLREQVIFHRNCRDPEEMIPEGSIDLNLYNIDLNWFIDQSNSRAEYIEGMKDVPRALRMRDIHCLCSIIGDDICNFYQAVSVLYPAGSAREAWGNLYKCARQTNRCINSVFHIFINPIAGVFNFPEQARASRHEKLLTV